ncbi:unnamed protein product [Gordionus sp. m RMFG-2023]|uniref:replication factor C subunit 1-like isoform X2 n=1 Tax=Gordionus sp. m RMFG-2023 TaxID=3053472 RepID=UPI0030E4BA48
MDIRKYFGNKDIKQLSNKITKKKKASLLSNHTSEDEEPLPQIMRSRKKNLSVNTISSESDEETNMPKKLGKNIAIYNKDLKMIKSINDENCSPKKDNISSKVKCRNITANEYFNSKSANNKSLTQHITLDIEREEITPTLVTNIIPENSKDQKVNKKTKERNVDQSIAKKAKIVKKQKANKDEIEMLEEIHKSSTRNSKPFTHDNLENDEKTVAKKSAYNAFKQREGPKALGLREIPEGQENCFEGLIFVVTGILESLERDKCKEIIEIHGGKLTLSISRKTDYMVVGREPGPAKIEKAKTCKVKQINEDQFFELLKTLPGKESKYLIYDPENETNKIDQKVSQANENAKLSNKGKRTSFDATLSAKAGDIGKYNGKKVTWKMNIEDDDIEYIEQINAKKPTSVKKQKLSDQDIVKKPHGTIIKNLAKNESDKQVEKVDIDKTYMWVDKYKPKCTRDIIGQQGDKSSLNKLMQWLGDWFYNHGSQQSTDNKGKQIKSAKKGYNQQENSDFKAALLSGPPGVGKTTTAILTSKELGFTYSELNASNIRSKKCLKNLFSDSLTSYNMPNFLQGNHSKFKNHVLIMDEVDGMAGNEDRGGIQELIALIKTTKMPIICICNQRGDPKMRMLVNYCYDLRFSKPRPEQIKEAMLKLLYNEKVTIEPAIVQRVIQACNSDIRQIIHSLSLFSADSKSLKYADLGSEIKTMKKDIKLDDFEITRTMFSAESSADTDVLRKKADLFFMDYTMVPLFIQDNYLTVQSFAANKDNDAQMLLISQSADFISDGDLMTQTIQKTNNWSLLPLVALSSAVAPGEIMKGYFGGMINFPKFFGKNSKKTKFQRMLKELKTHMMLRTYSDWLSINLDYMNSLKNSLSLPLLSNATNNNIEDHLSVDDGIDRVISTMHYYYLLKDDLDNIVEMSKWESKTQPCQGKKGQIIKDTFSLINPKVKAALTRAYNKRSFRIPYVLEHTSDFVIKRKSGRSKSKASKKISLDNEEIFLEDGNNTNVNEESGTEGSGGSDKEDPDFDIVDDKMIKKKTTIKKQSSKAKKK